jgi:hypothetical protein
MSAHIPDIVSRDLVFEKLPKCLHPIIWDYIGCVCDKDHFICDKKFNTLVNYYDRCNYQHNHTCNGSIQCKSNLQSIHENICPVYNNLTKRDPVLMYCVRHLDNKCLFFRMGIKKSESRDFIDKKIECYNKSWGYEKTIHDFDVSYNNDPTFILQLR